MDQSCVTMAHVTLESCSTICTSISSIKFKNWYLWYDCFFLDLFSEFILVFTKHVWRLRYWPCNGNQSVKDMEEKSVLKDGTHSPAVREWIKTHSIIKHLKF
jgi:hypothetical protein